jgi:hypothetical protein
MTSHNGSAPAAGGLFGSVWFIGWLFTWAFAKLVWWQIIVGIVIWPYFLGSGPVIRRLCGTAPAGHQRVRKERRDYGDL